MKRSRGPNQWPSVLRTIPRAVLLLLPGGAGPVVVAGVHNRNSRRPAVAGSWRCEVVRRHGHGTCHRRPGRPATPGRACRTGTRALPAGRLAAVHLAPGQGDLERRAKVYEYDLDGEIYNVIRVHVDHDLEVRNSLHHWPNSQGVWKQVTASGDVWIVSDFLADVSRRISR